MEMLLNKTIMTPLKKVEKSSYQRSIEDFSSRALLVDEHAKDELELHGLKHMEWSNEE